MADQGNPRSYRTSAPFERAPAATGQQTQQPSSDPLAELARLIGQTDPFAERDYQRARPAHDDRESAEQPVAAATYAAAPQQAQAYAPEQPEPAYEQYRGHEQEEPLPADAYPPAYDPYYGADPQSLDEAEYHEELARRRRARRLVTVFAIVGLAVFGAAGAYGFRSFMGHAQNHGAPPVIMADAGPTKVIPVAKASEASANKLSYERVGAAGATEKMVPREEKPVDVKAAAVTPPRIVYPSPEATNEVASPPPATIPVSGQPANASVLPLSASSSPPPNGSGAILPSAHKVRTLTIRPDMTVVADASAAAKPVVSVSDAAPSPAPTRGVMTTLPRSAGPAPVPPPPAAAASAAPAPTHTAPPARQARRAMEPLSLSPGDVQSGARTPATTATTRPVALAAVPPAAQAGAEASMASGSYVVQVSSQRSEADAKASFRALQSRYPNVLGGRQSMVRRADLGSKGVYYRTLVGPFASSDQAAAFCSSLKAAGGQCLIHRN
jgi:hypothetical protein